LPNSNIIKIDNLYYLASDPHVVGHGANPALVPIPGDAPWSGRQIMIMVSNNGYNWQRAGWIECDDDASTNHVPCMYYENDTLYIFYATMKWNDWRQEKIRVLEIKRDVFEKW